MSGSAVAVRRTAPRLGEHNQEILTALGYDAAAVSELRRDRVI
jgi:crotonobetainyl-CoA:carnitine CoA-transferase CaiB-like acyl-CoA transferase